MINTPLPSRLRSLFQPWALLLLTGAATPLAWAGDQPQWGQRHSRNMVSEERGLPADCDPKSGRNVRWVADLGTSTYSTPVVARGRVFIGTNNGQPRDPRHPGDRGVLLCLDERTGRMVWQLVVPKLPHDPYLDCPGVGLTSSPAVEDDLVYRLSRHCISTPSVVDGLVFIADMGRGVHCVDTRTGQACWTRELDGEVWGSTLVADGRLYVGTGRGTLWVLTAGRDKQVLGSVDMGDPIHTTPVAANGVLYVATMTRLYALAIPPGNPKDE